MKNKLYDLYNSVSKSEYENIAYKYFVENLLIDKKRGNEKLETISGLNMEDNMPMSFIPSMFYTFMYSNPLINSTDRSTFIDAVPLILCVTNDGTSITGINFNMIPNNVRASVIDFLYDTYPDFYDNISSSYKINEDLANVLITNVSVVLQIIKKQTGYDISSAYRRYNVKYILNTRMIEYDQWEYIPFLVFKDAIRGVNLAVEQKKMIVDNQE